MVMIMTQRHWLGWDIRSWRWNIVGSAESVPRETQISWNGQEYNFPWFLRWDLCQISNILNLNQKSDPYLLEIMHFIDLPRCIKPNSTSQAALYVWLWNFSGNKNCCCPGQTPLKYCLPKLLSFKLGTFIWSNYTSFYMHINPNSHWSFFFYFVPFSLSGSLVGREMKGCFFTSWAKWKSERISEAGKFRKLGGD